MSGRRADGGEMARAELLAKLLGAGVGEVPAWVEGAGVSGLVCVVCGWQCDGALAWPVCERCTEAAEGRPA